MKTTRLIDRSFRLNRAWLLASLTVALAISPAFATEPKSGDKSESKSQALFMGADISIEYKREIYRVKNVVNGAFVIKVGKDDVVVPLNWDTVKLKVDRTLKLADFFTHVKDLKGVRAYTMANDPVVLQQRSLAASETMYADSVTLQRQTQDRLADMQKEFDAEQGQLGGPSLAAKEDLAAAKTNSSQALVGPGANLRDTPAADGTGNFDAMEFTFEVSSEQTLDSPYVVILADFSKAGTPKDISSWVYAQPLEPIGSATKKVHILRGGFPRAFELKDYQVHFYNHGKEIVTDVAPKLVALTRDEAFSYARFEYLGSHKGATLPATPFMGKLSPEMKSSLTSEQLDRSYYVKVTKDGLPVEAFSDPALSRGVSGTVADLIQNVRFYPALRNGVPVDGMAELNFPHLAL
ncbi:MAG TPA: hypothetical protein VGM64_18380 [Lacunisphaera sp.]|jgi:hypothetical protein